MRPTVRRLTLALVLASVAARAGAQYLMPHAAALRRASYNPTTPTTQGPATNLRVTARTYDALDRLSSETVQREDGSTATLVYTYWRNGLRKTVTDALGRVTFYEYDGRNRLWRLTANHGLADAQVTTYTYWPDSLLKRVTKPDGTVASYEYDRADRIQSIVVRKGETELLSFAYVYDENGNRTSQVETNGGNAETTAYAYDALDRLESVTYPDGRSVAYGYDAVGNRTAETERDPAAVVTSQKTAVFDAANRISTITDTVNSANDARLTFDANGNLVTKTAGATTASYIYDLRDQLAETREGERVTARFAYDAFGRRYLKIGDDGVRQYLYDQTSLLEEFTDLNVEVAKYEWGGDRLVSLFRVDAPRRYFQFDALGSVAALTDDSGVAARYHYDAWGQHRATAELDQSTNRFGFTGHYFDTETGLYFAKARYFDPKLGRFLTQDSYLGQIDEPPSLHRYVYGWNRPTFFIDPDGHEVRPTGVDTTRITWDAYGRPYVGAVTAVETEVVEVTAYPDRGSAVAADLDVTLAQPMGRTAVRGMGAVRAAGGVGQVVMGGGAMAAPEPTMLSKAGGAVLIAHGVDDVQAGLRQAITGQVAETLTGTGIRKTAEAAGASPEAAAWISAGGETALVMGAGFAAGPAPAQGPTTLGRITRDVEAPEVTVTYKPGAGINRAEFTKQLAEQEAGLNQMTAGEIKARIEAFREHGRPSTAAAAIRSARRASPEAAEGNAGLHTPDCCIGGNPENIGGFGQKGANSSLGSLNKAKQVEIYDAVKDLPPDAKVQFKFVVEKPKN